MILVVDAATKESKEFGQDIIWGIKDKSGEWYDFHGGFKPSKGQSLNVRIENVNGKNGKTNRVQSKGIRQWEIINRLKPITAQKLMKAVVRQVMPRLLGIRIYYYVPLPNSGSLRHDFSFTQQSYEVSQGQRNRKQALRREGDESAADGIGESL